MIILDTNIISEMMKSAPSLNVINWLNHQNTALLFITTITIAEITYGLHALPASNRRKILEKAFHDTITEGFEHRIHTFDQTAAQFYSEIMGNRKRIGRPLSILDGQIASIARANHDTRDFSECEIELINPFAGAH